MSNQTVLAPAPIRRHLPRGRVFLNETGRARGRVTGMEATRTSLLRRVRDPQDRVSWGEFVALYEPLLVGYVRKQNINENDARDVVQDSKGRFRSWLYRVAYNAVIDWVRARRRVQNAEVGHRTLWQEAVVEPPAEWDAMVRERQLQFAMTKVRGQTVAKSWTCFEEHLLNSRSGAEIGAELDLPANTVYVNAMRVLRRIKVLCATYEEEPGDEA